MKRRIQFILPPDQGGVLLLDYLANRFTYHSRTEWLDHIQAARVEVNAAAVLPDCRLMAGDRVEYIARDMPEPPVSFDVEIVFEDQDVMVINKPANLPCHPAGRYFNHTLWAWLKTQHGVTTPALVNRLDRETSGLLVVAKTAMAESKCRAQFLQRSVVKRYLVLVEGAFPESLQAAGWLLPDPNSGVHKRRRFERCEIPSMKGVSKGGAPLTEIPSMVGYPKRGAPLTEIPSKEGCPKGGVGSSRRPGRSAPPEWAVTDFRLLRTVREISVVEAVLHTGRLHQIRATLHSLGFPVVGDKIYGPDPLMFVRFCKDELTGEDWRRLRLTRQALHSMELEFTHPATGLPLHFEAPLPADMAALA